MADDAAVKLTEVQGTAALLELSAALDDLTSVQAALSGLTTNQAHPPPASPVEAKEIDAASDADSPAHRAIP